MSLCRYREKLSIAASIAVTFWRHGTSIAGDGVIYESGGSVSRRRRFIGSRSVERWRCSRFNDRIGVEGNGDIEDANKSGIPVKVVFAQLAVYDGRWMDGEDCGFGDWKTIRENTITMFLFFFFIFQSLKQMLRDGRKFFMIFVLQLKLLTTIVSQSLIPFLSFTN